jgi:hypothetical protein
MNGIFMSLLAVQSAAFDCEGRPIAGTAQILDQPWIELMVHQLFSSEHSKMWDCPAETSHKFLTSRISRRQKGQPALVLVCRDDDGFVPRLFRVHGKG